MDEIELISREINGALEQYFDFPRKGVLYEDFLPVFRSSRLCKGMARAFAKHIEQRGLKVDYVVGLEAKGFLIGLAIALEIGAGFVPVRKQGKLPGKLASAPYKKEYGSDIFEIQIDCMPKGSNVVVVDDVLATGGSAGAAGKVVEACGVNIVEFQFVMEIVELGGAKVLGSPTFSLLKR
ncbi:unnamed protein product [Kuraishia capsulata CBS 1993]|uniref:adenine phosphoribosyltransferase n=1 Tax=Kuraishia capsulata CBS 1993 TaxID=1382522 RepID=W6MS34_9ASCO|nr:uncharacterized protein KUCA_T00005594001 [Kuraishia capsulata CBS 1993]CDK29601.1 unnamed protein product [Kuraishia capsulata CBS 1993]